MTPEVMEFCRSRSDGRRCTREIGHRGLHRHRGVMWTDAGADALACAGTGKPGGPAALLPSGFPHGRALCPTCLGFVELDDAGRLRPHETGSSDGPERGEWFNTFGWTG